MQQSGTYKVQSPEESEASSTRGREEGALEEAVFEQNLEGQVAVRQVERWGKSRLGRRTNCVCV